jgi:ankyrin repeat protein
MLAVKLGNVTMVQLLLEAGADINARDDWVRTALFYGPVTKVDGDFRQEIETGSLVRLLHKSIDLVREATQSTLGL